MTFSPRIALTQADLSAAIAFHPITVALSVCVREAIAQLYAQESTGTSACDVDAGAHLRMQAQQSCVLVLEADQLVGIVTERDLVRLSARNQPLDEVAIAAVMSTPVITLHIADFTDCLVPLNLFQRYQIGHLPVVDDQGRILGLLTRSSVWQLLQPSGQGVELAADIALANFNKQPAALHEHHQVESQLRNVSERLELALQSAQIGAWEWDVVNDRLFWDARTFTIFGVSPESFAGNHAAWRQLIHPEDLASQQQAQYQKIWDTQDTENQIEFRIIRPDGSIRVVSASAMIQRNAQGEPQRLIGLNVDVTEHKQAELENRRLKERLQFMLSTTPAVIFTCKAEDDYGATFVSDNIYEVMGYTPTEFLARSSFWADHIHPEDAPRVFAALPQLFEQGKHTHEYRFRHQAGHYVWVQNELRLVRDQQGNPSEIVGYFVDISERARLEAERKQAEQELRGSRDLREVIFNESADALFLVDPHTLLTLDCNQRATQLFDVQDKLELIGIQGHTLQRQPFAEHELVAIEADMKANGFWSRELEYVTRQGRVFWGNIAAKSILVAGRSVNLVRVTDISDRKQSELRSQQQAAQERLVSAIARRIRGSLNLQEILATTVSEVHQLLHVDRVLVYQILPDGTGKSIAESVSPGWPSILDMIFPGEIFPEENYDRYLQGRIFALSDRETEPVLPCLVAFLENMQIRAKLVVPIIQNTTLWGLLIAHQCEAPRQWQAWEIELLQQLSGQLAIAIHQSELYAQLQASHQKLTYTNAELIRATRLKDEFLANMSHELRTPLNAILGMSEGLLEEIFGEINQRQKKAIATVERSGEHLLSLINDILEVSKIEAGKLELETTLISPDHLCASSLLFVKQQALKKQIQLTTTVSPDLHNIAVDERRIRQVLINLLTNAVKFTPVGGQVTLAVYLEPIEINLPGYASSLQPPASSHGQEPHYPCCHLSKYDLCMAVTDTGIGIAIADQAKLFQPFVQVDSSLNRQYEGSGLGLTLVKQIVELHGGSISLCSELGQGSCFTVRLPYLTADPNAI